MISVDGLLSDMNAGKDWLIAAVCILSFLLGIWMLRYRKLYIAGKEEQNHNLDLIENLYEGIYRSTPDGRQLWANKALVKLNGYADMQEMLAGVNDISKEWYVEPGRRAAFQAILQRDGRVEDFISEIYRHKTRERIWITEAARLVCDAKTGRVLFYEGSVREITETVKRLGLEERFQKLTSQLPGGLFQFSRHPDGSYTVPFLSAGWSKITGIETDAKSHDPAYFTLGVFEEDRAAYFDSLKRSGELLQQWNIEFRFRTPQGIDKWLWLTAKPEMENGTIIWHGYLADVTVQKKREQEIEALAYFDPLTKLPNRRLFFDRMATSIANCDQNGTHCALLFIDLDNFKTLNDTQGHDTGDAFLTQVAARLRNCLGPKDIIARIGGDEFVVIVAEKARDRALCTRHAITTGNQVLAALREGFDLGTLHHVASASIGIVVFDGREKRADEILKRADIAMYQAKTSGRNGLALFDPVSMDREAERYRTLADLRVALAENQLELHYQVQVDDDRRVMGAEALLRWNHPQRGLIMPDKFIPLAEQFGLNDELSTYVLTQGIEALGRWQRLAQTRHLRLSLNISVQSFATEGLVAKIRDLVERHAVDASKLTLELTEHVMAKDQVRIAARMAELKAMGIRLSLDDFGTGYSSLTYLKRLPFDEVKIDGGFVADIETTESDRALVKTILAMARTLGLTTVAEHVENIRQEAFLRAFGCDLFQGFLYSQPLSHGEFMAFCEQAAVSETAPPLALPIRQLA